MTQIDKLTDSKADLVRNDAKRADLWVLVRIGGLLFLGLGLCGGGHSNFIDMQGLLVSICILEVLLSGKMAGGDDLEAFWDQIVHGPGDGLPCRAKYLWHPELR